MVNFLTLFFDPSDCVDEQGEEGIAHIDVEEIQEIQFHHLTDEDDGQSWNQLTDHSHEVQHQIVLSVAFDPLSHFRRHWTREGRNQ